MSAYGPSTFFTFTERMSEVERCSASGLAEESCWISLQLTRVVRLRWRHVVGAHHWAR
jgi:hypothetical protein